MKTAEQIDAADILHSHARALILHRHTAPEWMWENLANAVNRYDAARQAHQNALTQSAAQLEK